MENRIKEPKLDDNYIGSLTRLKNLTRKFMKNNVLQDYDKVMREYMINDMAEVSPVDSKKEKIYYMPHQPVFREDKATTKLRIVFDASAHAPYAFSLNDMLEKGDNLIPELFRILLNFRTGRIGLIADIEKAFLQVSIAGEGRDALSFLWYKTEIQQEVELPEVQTYRMTRVTFGVKSSPFLLTATIKKHLKLLSEIYPQTTSILENSFYIDDLVWSTNVTEDAKELCENATEIMLRANMKLRKWKSNNKELNELFYKKDILNKEPLNKVLGVEWNTSSDTIQVDLQQIKKFTADLRHCTKRNILQLISRIYDPLGIMSPCVMRLNILLQEIWKLHLEWDALVPLDLQNIASRWIQDLEGANNVAIDRNIGNDQIKFELHIFADASPKAYGVVAYLVSEKCVGFICSKGRVAPLKQKDENLSLPKLELTAALCAARLQDYIIKNMNVKIEKVYLWSDSKISLWWITGSQKKLKPFVENRVQEIRKLTEAKEWNYCPSKENPADLLTRGTSTKILESSLWKHGPDWLCNKNEWPDRTFAPPEEENATQCLSILLQEEPIFDPERYEKLDKTYRITAYVILFIKKLLHKSKNSNVSILELNEAEEYWIKYTQGLKYSVERSLLKNKHELNKNSNILKLSPFLDSKEILRLGGRLQEADLPYETKHPIILSDSSITRKIIWKIHIKLHHGGVNQVLQKTREKYWIISGRQLVKRTLSKCITCKKLRGKE